MQILKKFYFTVLPTSDLGKVQESNRYSKSVWATFSQPFESFHFIDHKLLIEKLYRYVVLLPFLNIISSYLKHRTQRTKITDCFSARLYFSYGVPQVSIVSLLLLNVNMIDLFNECKDNGIANYADNITSYSCAIGIPLVILHLHRSFQLVWQ